MMWSLLFIILLVRFGLLSGHLCGNAAGSVGHMISLSFVYFQFLFIFLFESRSGLVSVQTDHSNLCVLVAFLTKPKPHFKVLPGHIR